MQAGLKGLAAGLVVLGATVIAAPAMAADWDAKISNPKPAADDVTLPMPCGGAMVFRTVAVPADGPLGDTRVMLGGGDPARGAIEGVHPEYIAGSFSDGKSQRTYLIGKYEVTQAQYEAVMADTPEACPKVAMPKRLPQTEIGWFDAVRFTERYSVWLRKSAAKALPKEGDETAYIRLPTEAEWEYAARGGASVSPADFGERTFAMPDGMAKYVWFAGTQSANGKPQLTGLLIPGPLGIHDMLGNVDEMVLEPFRLNKLGRSHGQAGGYVVRGGNYLTGEQDIRTALRQEVPYFDDAGVRKSKTTGFRVVAAVPSLTSAAQLKAVQQAWEKLGATSATDDRPGVQLGKQAETPIEDLAVLAKAAPDPEMKKRLEQVQASLRADLALRDEQRDRAARTALRMGAFLGQKLADDGKWVDRLRSLYESQKAADPNSDRTKDYQAKVQENQKALDDNLRYYADTVIRIAEDYGDDTLKRQKDLLATEMKNLGLAHLVPYLDRHTGHVLGYRDDHKVSRQKWLDDYVKM